MVLPVFAGAVVKTGNVGSNYPGRGVTEATGYPRYTNRSTNKLCFWSKVLVSCIRTAVVVLNVSTNHCLPGFENP